MTGDIVRATLAISETPELAMVAKATAILVTGLCAGCLLRRAAASVQALVLAATFVVLALLPLAVLLAPPVTVPIPSPVTGVVDPATYEWAEMIQPHSALLPSVAPSTGDLAPPAVAPRFDLGRALRVVWMIGMSLALIPIATTLWRLRAIRRTGVPWLAGEALAQRLASEMGVTRPIAVLRHEAVAVPMTCGVRRPALLLPWDATAWSEADLERAFVHELEHVRRADWATLVLAHLICASYWFHPLFWVARRRLQLAAERACDDMVLARGESVPYAAQLVRMAERLSGREPRPLLAMAARCDLSARVHAVLDGARRRHAGPSERAAALTAVTLGLLTIAPLAADPTQGHVFDVAAVRRNLSGERNGTIDARGSDFRVVNQSLERLISYAYGIQRYGARPFTAIEGLPDWKSERFDIIAKPAERPEPSPPGTLGPYHYMLQRLLADRFKLATHWVSRDQPGYALVLARDDGRLGPRLRHAAVDCGALRAALRSGEPPSEQLIRCGMRSSNHFMEGADVPFSALVGMLATRLDRPVVDRTRLEGRFDILLTWTPNGTPADYVQPTGPEIPSRPWPALDPLGPHLFDALRGQLGFSLEETRLPMDVLVIDRVERPVND